MKFYSLYLFPAKYQIIFSSYLLSRFFIIFYSCKRNLCAIKVLNIVEQVLIDLQQKAFTKVRLGSLAKTRTA